MFVKIEPRSEPSRIMKYCSPLIAALLMLFSGLVIFTLLGKPPGQAFYAFFIEPINDLYGIGELFIKAAPLMLIGTGLAIGFRASIWNIGAEGQLTLGAICGGAVAIYFQNSDGWFVLPLMIAAGAVGGTLWAAIPAFLKTKPMLREAESKMWLPTVALSQKTTLSPAEAHRVEMCATAPSSTIPPLPEVAASIMLERQKTVFSGTTPPRLAPTCMSPPPHILVLRI